MRVREIIRWFIVTVCVGLLLAIFFSVVGEFFIELAREKGWYDSPSTRLDSFVGAASAFMTRTWVLIAAALLVGLVVGVWLDKLMRAQTKVAPPFSSSDPTGSREKERPAPWPAKVETSEEHAEKHKLMIFVADYLVPACQADDHLQYATLQAIIVDNPTLKRIASYGLTNEQKYADFWAAKEILYKQTAENSFADLKLSEIFEKFNDVRAGYEEFCKRPLMLTGNKKPPIDERPEWAAKWNEWAERHNALIQAHDQLCESGDLPQLYQPKSRRDFGQPVELV